jgi:hypothetical protein
MKGSIYWDITQCIPFRVTWLFVGTNRLNVQGLRVTQAGSQHKTGSKKFLLFNFEDGDDLFFRTLVDF